MKAKAWAYDEVIIGVGVTSGPELEAAARTSGYLHDGEILEDVRAYRIPAAILHQERWDGEQMYACELDAAPGRGYVRVLIGDPTPQDSGEGDR